MIGKLGNVLDDPPRRELIGSGHLSRAMSPHVDAHHAKLAREMRHPGVEARRAAHRGVHEYDRIRRPPRVSVVVERVGDFEAVGSFETVHITNRHCGRPPRE